MPNAAFDEVLSLPKEDRDEVIDAMSAENFDAFSEYASSKTAAPAPVKEVQHPNVGNAERAVLQNFANDADVIRKHLSKTHPELDVEVQRKESEVPEFGNVKKRLDAYDSLEKPMPRFVGPTVTEDRVVMRKKGEAPDSPWSALDPQTGFHPINDPREALKDITDAAYDVPAGILQADAAAMGGLGGAAVGGAAGGPAGAAVGGLGGASAMGALSGAGLQAAKQAIGRTLGIEQDYDTDAIKDAAKVGAVAPLVTGTSATPAQAMKAGVPYASQRGLVTKTLREGTARLGAAATGMPLRDIKQARDLLPEMQSLEKQGAAGIQQKVDDSKEQIQNALYGHQQRLGNEIHRVLAEAGTKVDVRSARAEFEDMLKELQAMKGTPAWTANREGELNHLQKLYDDTFVPKLSDDQKTQLAKLQREFRAVDSQFQAANAEVEKGFVERPQMEQLFGLQRRRNELAAEVNRLGNPPVPDFVDALWAKKIQDDLTDFSNARMGGGDKYAGKKQFDKAVISRASAARKHMRSAIEEAVKTTDNAYGGKGVGPLWQRYSQLKETQEALSPFLNDSAAGDKQSFTVLRNLGAKSNVLTRKRLEDLDREYGTTIVPNADLLNSMAIFSDPSNTALSGWGATSTSRTMRGRALGAAMGGIMGHLLAPDAYGREIGAALGGVGGQMATTPAAVRKYMNTGQHFRNASGFVQRPFGLDLKIPQVAAQQGLWEALHDDHKP